MYRKYFKRCMDFILSLAAILVLSPVYLIVAIFVRVKLGSPILFCQKRPGKDEKIFNMYKFRTMTDERDENGELLPDEVRLTKFGKFLRSTSQKRPGKDEKIFNMYKFRTMTDERDENGELLPDEVRLTKFGKFLRSTSLDELPELFNILKGDMSIIGPRPLLVEYLPRYNAEQKRRHEVRPGLSGLAQANGRNAISWEQKFKYDVEYGKWKKCNQLGAKIQIRCGVCGSCDIFG